MSREESMQSIIAFWQRIISDDEMPVQNRMKASELLYRSLQQEEPQVQQARTEMDAAKRIRLARAIIAKYAKQGKGGSDDPAE